MVSSGGGVSSTLWSTLLAPAATAWTVNALVLRWGAQVAVWCSARCRTRCSSMVMTVVSRAVASGGADGGLDGCEQGGADVGDVFA